MIAIYICEKCNRVFKIEFECREHEKNCGKRVCINCDVSQIKEYTLKNKKGEETPGHILGCYLGLDMNDGLKGICRSYEEKCYE